MQHFEPSLEIPPNPDIVYYISDEYSSEGCTHLMKLAALKKADRDKVNAIVKDLLADGADPNVECAIGFTALYIAMLNAWYNDNLELIGILLDAGAVIIPQIEKGKDPPSGTEVIYAKKNVYTHPGSFRHRNIFREICYNVSTVADPNMLSILRLIIERIGKDTPKYINFKGADKTTFELALTVAAVTGKIDTIELMIPFVNAPCNIDVLLHFRAMYIADREQDTTSAKVVLPWVSKPEAADRIILVLDFLISRGVELTLKSRNVINYSDIAVVQKLMSIKSLRVDPFAQLFEMRDCPRGVVPRAVQFLLDAGAKEKINHPYITYPIEYALNHNLYTMAEILIANGADINLYRRTHPAVGIVRQSRVNIDMFKFVLDNIGLDNKARCEVLKELAGQIITTETLLLMELVIDYHRRRLATK